MNRTQQSYLDDYLTSLPVVKRRQYTSYSAEHFCADKDNANTCAALVRAGTKTATCSMKYWYQSGQYPMPAVGHLQVVTDWYGKPSSIIETTDVREERFSDVSHDFAKAEGEGDCSLKWWRRAHWQYFSRECREAGIEASEDMVLVLERFKLVYVH